jgi:hypothetical protein
MSSRSRNKGEVQTSLWHSGAEIEEPYQPEVGRLLSSCDGRGLSVKWDMYEWSDWGDIGAGEEAGAGYS